MSNSQIPVVIDKGSSTCKAGLADQQAPETAFPACIGRPFHYTIPVDMKPYYIGREAEELWNQLSISYPINGGSIDFDGASKIWNHCFYNELKIDPAEQPVHITEVAINPRSNREQTIQLFFEDFAVPAFYLSNQAVLALYSSGRTTGLVFDAGASMLHMVPVYEGHSVKHSVCRAKISGIELTNWLGTILKESGLNLNTSLYPKLVNNIKESSCYVALDYEEEMKLFDEGDSRNSKYTLPDGRIIDLGSQQITCPEVMFRPELIGQGSAAIHQLAVFSIKKSDPDLRKELFKNILIAGGTSMFSGINDRLEKEIRNLVPETTKVKVIAPSERRYSAWTGGSILSMMDFFLNRWILKVEYQECGGGIVHRKCF